MLVKLRILFTLVLTLNVGGGKREATAVPTLQDLSHEHLAPPRHRHRLPSILPSLGQPISATAHHPRGAPPPPPLPHGSGSSSAASGLIFPTDFGADPTGHDDSTEAFRKAMAVLLSRNRTIGLNMSSARGVACADMGGATLHLGGGDYLISEPIIIPCHVCNMRVHGGTLRASSRFPANSSYMIESGYGCPGVDNAGSPEFIGFSELLLDCRGYAAGGMHIFDNLGTNVGPRIFVTGFSEHGISIEVGHEVMVHEAWVCPWLTSGDEANGKKPWSEFNGTIANGTSGILVWGADHYLTNVIVFEAGMGLEVGVEIAGGGNLLTGVHTWSGPIGIFVCYGEEWPRQSAIGQAHNRIVDSYLDMNQLVACDPTMLLISDSYFLAGGHITLRATPALHAIKGLSIHGNTFRPAAGRGGPTIALDESRANFTQVIDMSVSGSIYGIDGPSWDPNTTISTTSVTRSMRKVHATEWAFDLSDILLFPHLPIKPGHVQYSIEIEAPEGNDEDNKDAIFARHASRPAVGTVVRVVTDVAVTATVTITVDQSDHSEEFWQNKTCPCPWSKDCKCY